LTQSGLVGNEYFYTNYWGAKIGQPTSKSPPSTGEDWLVLDRVIDVPV